MAPTTEISEPTPNTPHPGTGDLSAPNLVTRRRFLNVLSRTPLALAAAGGGSLAFTLAAAKWCQVERITLPVPNLPAPFVGLTIAFLVDTHHGPFVPLWYLEHVVAMTNALGADLVALGGDFVQRRRSRHLPPDRPYLRPGIEVLSKLKAPLGSFAVLGNHDNWVDTAGTQRYLAEYGIRDLSNRGVWLERGGARLRFCGLDDHTTGVEDLPAALGDTRPGDACILLAHNPDVVEDIRDPRVGFVLSGHTHGGQVVLPYIGAPIVPSSYGQKYVQGFVQGPVTRVYVSRGVGTIMPAVRFRCPPEVTFITLCSTDAGTADSRFRKG